MLVEDRVIENIELLNQLEDIINPAGLPIYAIKYSPKRLIDYKIVQPIMVNMTLSEAMEIINQDDDFQLCIDLTFELDSKFIFVDIDEPKYLRPLIDNLTSPIFKTPRIGHSSIILLNDNHDYDFHALKKEKNITVMNAFLYEEIFPDRRDYPHYYPGAAFFLPYKHVYNRRFYQVGELNTFSDFLKIINSIE